MNAELNKSLVRRLFEDEDRSEGHASEEIYAPGFTAHVVGFPPMDREAFKQFLNMWYSAFSDWSHSFENLLAEGDRVAVRLSAEATHTGEFMGLPATGPRISITSIGIAKIADGQLVEWWNTPDRLGLMQQLGLVPPPEVAR